MALTLWLFGRYDGSLEQTRLSEKKARDQSLELKKKQVEKTPKF